MTNMHLVRREKAWGDTAVDGLLAGLVGGLVMGLFLGVAGWLSGGSLLATLGYFDPAQTGSWLTGLLAHLAVSAIYGVGLALLLRVVGWIRPSLTKLNWLWGALYGLLLWGVRILPGSPGPSSRPRRLTSRYRQSVTTCCLPNTG